MSQKRIKTVALFSGGLDSILAIKVIQEQNIEVIAFHFQTFLTAVRSENSNDTIEKGINQLKVPLKKVPAENDFVAVLKNPRYGYGRNYNPCIDCKIHIFQKAKAYMEEIQASFLISGEVLGERPMSQNKQALTLIEKKAGIEGLVVRPLSGQLLDETIPEKEGWIDRKKLLNIKGRCRKPQFALAQKYGITEYPTPAGGCLLTEQTFAKRAGDVLEHNRDADINDIKLLRYGRHFRINDTTKIIVGRDEKDNSVLLNLARKNDYIFHIEKYPSPIVLLRGEDSETNRHIAAFLCKRYSDVKTDPHIAVSIYLAHNHSEQTLLIPRDLSQDTITSWML